MKTVLITGASSGIGRDIAMVFAENNYRPILVARRKNMLDMIADEIKTSFNVNPMVIAMNLSKPDSSEKLFEQIQKENIHVDILVNNAGIGDFGAFESEDIGKIESMMTLNMLTLTKLSRLFAPLMVKKGFGHILNISSTAAFQPVPNFAVYSATKAFVLQFSEAIGYELKPHGVYVTAVCPGATRSEFQDAAGMEHNDKLFSKAPMAFIVAEYAYEAMLKKKSVAIYGSKNRFLNFIQRFSPRKMTTMVAAKMMKA